MHTGQSVYTRAALAASLAVVHLCAAVGSVTLTHANVRVESGVVNGKLAERFWAKGNAGWVLIATSDGKTQGSLSIRVPGGSALPGDVRSVTQEKAAIVEEVRGNGWTVKKRIEPLGAGNWVRVSAVFTPDRSYQLHSFVDSFHTNLKPDWSFSPSIGGFNPDAKYKSPLILAQKGSIAFGIVPALLALDRATLQRCNHALDLDVTGNAKFSVGFVPAKASYHVVFKEDLDRNWAANEPVSNVYYLYLSANATVREAYRETVRFQWSQFGRAAQAEAADEQSGTDAKYETCHLWDEWRHVVWDQESRESWLTVPLAGSVTGGAVLMLRAHSPKPSVYLGAWFNSLRTSYGMALYARRTGIADLLALAQQTVALALNAPGRDGAFKCFAVPNDSGDTGKADQVFWGAGDGAGTSVTEGYLGFDMSWTGYWLLKWREAGLPGSESILARCLRLADFLIARQKPNGSLPTRFDDAGQVQEDLSVTVAAETAPVVRFLFELAKADHNPKYRQAALSGLAFLDRFIVPERKWYDFETFWSCSPRLVAFDERTHQWPANNLALIHAVAAYLQAYQITGQQTYLAKGRSLLDYLLLYQQTWTNRSWRTCMATPCCWVASPLRTLTPNGPMHGRVWLAKCSWTITVPQATSNTWSAAWPRCVPSFPSHRQRIGRTPVTDTRRASAVSTGARAAGWRASNWKKSTSVTPFVIFIPGAALE